MLKSQGHRKQVKHFHEPGDFHELTFSCYRRMPLLTNDLWRRWLAEIIDEAAAAPRFHLNAFVFMPEHVHLLVWPTDREATADDISTFLAAVKRPLSRRVKAALKAEGTKSAQRLLERLTVRTRPGKTSFRFWQEGSGYDRNLQTEKSVMASIDYIHDNPVKRRLVKIATKWKWSSARWYVSEGKQIDAELPQLHFPSAELFYSGT